MPRQRLSKPVSAGCTPASASRPCDKVCWICRHRPRRSGDIRRVKRETRPRLVALPFAPAHTIDDQKRGSCYRDELRSGAAGQNTFSHEPRSDCCCRRSRSQVRLESNHHGPVESIHRCVRILVQSPRPLRSDARAHSSKSEMKPPPGDCRTPREPGIRESLNGTSLLQTHHSRAAWRPQFRRAVHCVYRCRITICAPPMKAGKTKKGWVPSLHSAASPVARNGSAHVVILTLNSHSSDDRQLPIPRDRFGPMTTRKIYLARNGGGRLCLTTSTESVLCVA